MLIYFSEEKQEGPYPVLYSLSTGGELNIFHVDLRDSNNQAALAKPEKFPGNMRTAQQFGGLPPLPNVSVPVAPQAIQPASIQSPFSKPAEFLRFVDNISLSRMFELKLERPKLSR